MRLGNFVLATVVGLGSLGVSIQPSKAQSFPDCHQNAHQVGDSYSIHPIDNISGLGQLEVKLMYCDSDKSNFGRVVFHAETGGASLSNFDFYVSRLAGPDGPADGRAGHVNTLTDAQYTDTQVLYSPDNQSRVCVVLHDITCTAYH